MASDFEWKLTLVPDTARYPGLSKERIFMENRTRLQIAFILNQISDEFGKIYGVAVALPTSFILKIRENDGEFTRVPNDDRLRKAVAKLVDRELQFEATAVYADQDDKKDKKLIPPVESSDDDIIVESGPIKSNVKDEKKRKRSSKASSPHGSSSVSPDIAQSPAPPPTKKKSPGRPKKTTASPKRGGIAPRKSLATKAARASAPSTSRTVTVDMPNNRKPPSSHPSEIEAEDFEPSSSPPLRRSPEESASSWARSIAINKSVPKKSADASPERPRANGSRAGTMSVANPAGSDDDDRSVAGDDEPTEPSTSKGIRTKRRHRRESKPSSATKSTPAIGKKKQGRKPKSVGSKSGSKSKTKKKDSCCSGPLVTSDPALITSVWLRHTLPIRRPYCPQVGDKVYYYPWSHKGVRDCVIGRGLAVHKGVAEEALQPWSDQQKLAFDEAPQTKELFVIKSMKYEIVKTPEATSNRLAILELDSLERTPKISITIHYQDVPGEDDFLVLKQYYDRGVKMYDGADCGKKLLKKRGRVVFWDDAGITPRWENGVISNIVDPRNDFYSIEFKWDTSTTGKKKKSVWFPSWEVFLLNKPEPKTTIPVTKEDIIRNAYTLEAKDWAGEEPSIFTARLLTVLEEMLKPEFGMAAGFKIITDLSDDYQDVVAYPVCLELIKERLQNGVYRRKESLIFDIEHLASTVAGCDGMADNIMRARIVQGVLLETIEDQSIVELSDELVEKHRIVQDVKEGQIEKGLKKAPSRTRSPTVEGRGASVCSSSTQKRKAPVVGPPRKMSKTGLQNFGCCY